MSIRKGKGGRREQSRGFATLRREQAVGMKNLYFILSLYLQKIRTKSMMGDPTTFTQYSFIAITIYVLHIIIF